MSTSSLTTPADIAMRDATSSNANFTQLGHKRVKLASTEYKENALLHEYTSDLIIALNEAYTNVAIFRDQYQKSQSENDYLKKQLQYSLTKRDPLVSTNQSSNESLYDKTIIVTNIEESDETRDTTTMTELVAKIDADVKPVKIKRLGNKIAGKKRIIALEFKSKIDRNKVLKKSRDVIKEDDNLSSYNVFFNKSLPKQEQEIQYILRNEAKLQKQNGVYCKIIKNQICDTTTSAPILCEANRKAKDYYDKIYSFRLRGTSTASSIFH